MAEDPIQSALDSFRWNARLQAERKYGSGAFANVEYTGDSEIGARIVVKVWEKRGEPFSTKMYVVEPSNPDDRLDAEPHPGETPEQGYARYERAVAKEILKVARGWKTPEAHLKLGSKMREIPSGFEIPESEREVRRYQKDYTLDRPWKKGAH